MTQVLIRRSNEGIRWPALKLCERLRAAEGGRSCVCRSYDHLGGYYVLESDGHAYSWFLEKPDALRHVARRPAPPPVVDVAKPLDLPPVTPLGRVFVDQDPTGVPPHSEDPR